MTIKLLADFRDGVPREDARRQSMAFGDDAWVDQFEENRPSLTRAVPEVRLLHRPAQDSLKVLMTHLVHFVKVAVQRGPVLFEDDLRICRELAQLSVHPRRFRFQ